jgi:hypothetical protein
MDEFFNPIGVLAADSTAHHDLRVAGEHISDISKYFLDNLQGFDFLSQAFSGANDSEFRHSNSYSGYAA